MQTIAILFVSIPWIVLSITVIRRQTAGLRLQRWQLETAVIGAVGLLATQAIDPSWSGLAGYGAALTLHGAASIRARVGDAYSALRDYVRRHAPDVEALHVVECLGKLRWYAYGGAAMGLVIAGVKGVAPVAIAQFLMSEAYGRYRRWHVARRGRSSMSWRAAVTGTARGEIEP